MPPPRTTRSMHGRRSSSARGDDVLLERYGNGLEASQPHALYSGTKSFWGVLAIAAQDDGLLSLDEPACETIPWREDARKSRVTLRMLLDLTAGFGFGGLGAAVPEYAQGDRIAAQKRSRFGFHVRRNRAAGLRRRPRREAASRPTVESPRTSTFTRACSTRPASRSHDGVRYGTARSRCRPAHFSRHATGWPTGATFTANARDSTPVFTDRAQTRATASPGGWHCPACLRRIWSTQAEPPARRSTSFRLSTSRVVRFGKSASYKHDALVETPAYGLNIVTGLRPADCKIAFAAGSCCASYWR